MIEIIILLIFILIGCGVAAYFLLNEDKKENLQGVSSKKPEEATMEQKLKCSQCGLDFPASEMITYENHYVCGGCKTSFVQKLREGVTLSPTTRFAGFWIRVGASLIEFIIALAIGWVMSLIIYQFFPKPHLIPGTRHFDYGVGYFLQLILSLSFGIGYYVWFIGTYGATLGKMACGIKVVMSDGSKIGYGRAFGRYWAQGLSAIIFCIGYLMVGPDKEKRALHDRICNTRVIYK